MTFETFVATGNVLEALALSRALACAETSAPRLLLLHGPPGSGKTHLLQAICHTARRLQPSIEIAQTTALELVEEMLNAGRRDREASRRSPWPAEALVTIDDLHTLTGKVVTQREFARLFQAALVRGCRLACAVGCLTEIPVLAEAVRALPMARDVELRGPNLDEMLPILGEMAKERGLALSAKMLHSIAAGCQGDVRLAAGAIARQRLQATARYRASGVALT